MEADPQRNLSCSTAARIKPHPARYDSLANRDNPSAWQSSEAGFNGREIVVHRTGHPTTTEVVSGTPLDELHP